MKASTGVREGRYRKQDAVFNGPRRRLWTWPTSLRATLTNENTAGGPEHGSYNGDGASSLAIDMGGSSGQYELQQLEMGEANAIQRPLSTLSIEGRGPKERGPVGWIPGIESQRTLG